jgi:hypothetical protein
MPVPIQNAWQTGVAITNGTHVASEAAVLREQGLLDAVVGPSDHVHTTASVSFECCVSEAVRHPAALEGDEEGRWLVPAVSSNYVEKARVLLRRIVPACPHSRAATVRMLYDWVLDHTLPLEGSTPEGFIIDTGIGDSLRQAQLFVTLCQLAGIAARWQCGAILERCLPAVEEREAAATRRVGQSVFAHGWAEVQAEPGRWDPVDFVAWRYGTRAVTPRNVEDARLLGEVCADSASFDDYYFGRLDPFRIHVSPDVAGLPLHPRPRANGSKVAHRLIEETRYSLDCEIVRAWDSRCAQS